MRSARAARFFVGCVREDRTWPPLTLGFGHSRSQEQNAAAVGNRDRLGPISVSRIFAVNELIPGTSVRSTPNARYRSSRSCGGSDRQGVLRISSPFGGFSPAAIFEGSRSTICFT